MKAFHHNKSNPLFQNGLGPLRTKRAIVGLWSDLGIIRGICVSRLWKAQWMGKDTLYYLSQTWAYTNIVSVYDKIL